MDRNERDLFATGAVEELRRHPVDGVVKFPGRTWVATAVNPG